MNPLVAAALKRIERAHQSASVEARPPRTSLATAVAYAPEREENIMNETVPPTSQLEFESEPVSVDLSAEELSQATEKPHLAPHLAVVPSPSESAVVAKPETAQPPKRLIVENDPALNYLDSICRSVRVDDVVTGSASVFRRIVSAFLDLIVRSF